MVWSAIAATINGAAVIFADNVGCIRVYFPASDPVSVYPEAVIVIPVPTFAFEKVNTGNSTKLTSSPVSIPTKTAVPETEPVVEPSYTLLLPVIPVMVNAAAVRFTGESA